MSNPASIQLIDTLGREGAARGMMFSAQDIVISAWQRGVLLAPEEVISRLQALVQQGQLGDGYTWSDWKGRGVIVFHRIGDDPRQYQPGTGPTKPSGQGFFSRLFGAVAQWFNPPPPEIVRGERPVRQQTSSSQQATLAAQANPVQYTESTTTGSVQVRTFDPRQLPAAQSPPPKSGKLGLDATHFLPINRDEQKEQASKVSLWGNAFFGRRDLIPPATDERTMLVDRGMVAGGILSPEQLAEIHRVGAEMDLVRPDISATRMQASRAGNAAVDEDRAARAAVKAKKKEEAARKKERRAAEVADRRANDIIYLGRGVSSRLHQRDSNVEKLQQLELPMLATPADVAAALAITIPQLRWLAFHTDVASRTHYIHFAIPKRSGGTRMLSAPHRKLATVQKWILRSILDKLPVESAAQGFVKGRSILTNAREHVGQQVVLNLDLEGFFPSIAFPRVRSVFQRCGYSPCVATILALLCTEAPRKQVQYTGQTYFVATGPRALPQGACTSPALSNQVTRRLDKRLQGLARRLQLSYTRYADDITLSGNAELKEKVGYTMARVRHITDDEGFVVNEAKSRALRQNTAQEVTGLVVNKRPGVPRKVVRRLRAILHNAQTTGLAAQNREGRTHFNSWLQGMISFVTMSQPELGAKMNSELQPLLSDERK